MAGLTNDQLENKIKWLTIFLVVSFLVSGVIFWRHLTLVSWARSTDSAQPNWGEGGQTGKLTSYLSYLSNEIHDHINLIEPGAQVAHKAQGDRHTDPPPPPGW